MTNWLGELVVGLLTIPKSTALFILGPAFFLFSLFLAHLAGAPIDQSNHFASLVNIVQEHHVKKIGMTGLGGWAVCWFAACRIVLKRIHW